MIENYEDGYFFNLPYCVLLRFAEQMAATPNAAKRYTHSIYAVEYRLAVNNIRASSEITSKVIINQFLKAAVVLRFAEQMAIGLGYWF